MADLASIRKAHPEYNDLSDQQLSDAIYAKFYSDMPRADFDARMKSPNLGPSYGAGEAGNPAAGLPVTPSQQREMTAAGGFQPLTPLGASANPRYETPFSGAPETGSYVPLKGGMVQTDAEPISKTLLAGLSRLTGTDRWMGERVPWAQSNTLDALESGALSGILMGGKNELGAVPEGILSTLQGEGFGAGFKPALKAADERDRILRENHPYAYYGGGAAGTLATAPLTPTIRTGGVLGRTLGNGAIQGAQGAVAGALSTDGSLTDRAGGALLGGALGGTLGAIGGRAGVPDAPQPQAMPLPSSLSAIPQRDLTRGAEYVRRQMGSAPLGAAAPDMLAAEAMGPRGKASLGALARMEGETAAQLEGRLSTRAIDRPQRILDSVARGAGVSPDAAAGMTDEMVARGRRAASPLYKEAFANHEPMASPVMDRLMARPAAKNGMAYAKRIMANEDVDPNTVGLTFMDDPNDWASQAGGLFPEQTAAVGARQPARAPSQGDSLVTFLAKRGGLTDQGGELSARDADRWHRALPFRNRLVNENGMDMGDAAQRALDAGYFPELGRDGSISGADLLAAIQAELSGKPRYARELSGKAQDTLSAREAEARWGPEGDDLGGDVPEYGARPMPESGAVYEQQPTTQGVDYVIRGIDDVIAGLPRQPNGDIIMSNHARSLIDTRKALRNELNRLAEEGNRNPAYVEAVREASDYLGAKEAFETAKKQLFNSRVSARDFAAKRKNMTPGERMYDRAGIANAIFDLAENGRLRPGALKTPIMRKKLEASLGKSAADELDALIKNEDAMRLFEQRYAPGAGSITSDIRIATDEMNQSPGMDAAINAGAATIRGGVLGGLSSLVKDGTQAIGDRLRTNGMSVPAKNAAGELLMASPAEIQAMLASIPRKGAATRQALKSVAHGTLTRSGRTSGILGSQATPRQ